MRYSNHIILIFLLLLGFVLKEYIHISSNLVSLFVTPSSAKKITIASELGYTKEMYVAVKGFDASSKVKVKEIAEKLEEIDGISSVQFSINPSSAVKNYYRKYYPLLADFDNKQLSPQEVLSKLESLYALQFNSAFYSPINRNDPLNLFVLETKNNDSVSHHGSYLSLGEYGYLLRIQTEVVPSEMNKAKVLYDKCEDVLKHYDNVIAFAPFFYTVENSSYIKSDIQYIIIVSVLMLLLVYYLLLKNLKLLFETLTTLFSSMLFATLVSTIFFDNFHILSLAFGMSITAVSIDYLLHYHFHGFYEQKKNIDKNVLYGFLTTMIAFLIFVFIPIPLISQISFFAVLSLSFAYLMFTFVFTKIQIQPYAIKIKKETSILKVPSTFVFVLSLLLLAYSAKNIDLDTNIRNLDYQNLSLYEKEALFKQANVKQLKPVIVEGKTEEVLLKNLHSLDQVEANSFSLASFLLDKQVCEKKREMLRHYDFKSLNTLVQDKADEIGFKKEYFKSAYAFTKELPSCDLSDFDLFKQFNLGIYEYEKSFFSIAFVPKLENALNFEFVSNISIQDLFKSIAMKMYEDLLFFSSLVLLAVMVLLIISVRKRFIYALNYILFPVSLTLAILVSTISVNLMHLFALIILIAIGIEYGIYMSNSHKQSNTILAIKYSLLSTFAGFGVLIFSSIVALNSIGVVISLGVTFIFILIKVMK